MSLILTTSPALEPVTLVETKSHLRISHADDDTYVTRLISAARRQIETRLNLALLQQSWSLFLDHWPDQGFIDLQLHPVQSIVDVITYGASDTPAVLDPSHYYLDKVSRPARLALRVDRPFPVAGRSTNGIEVKFTAGFGAVASAVPDDIRQALLLTVAAWFADRGETESGSLPLLALELIKPYRALRLS